MELFLSLSLSFQLSRSPSQFGIFSLNFYNWIVDTGASIAKRSRDSPVVDKYLKTISIKTVQHQKQNGYLFIYHLVDKWNRNIFVHCMQRCVFCKQSVAISPFHRVCTVWFYIYVLISNGKHVLMTLFKYFVVLLCLCFNMQCESQWYRRITWMRLNCAVCKPHTPHFVCRVCLFLTKYTLTLTYKSKQHYIFISKITKCKSWWTGWLNARANFHKMKNIFRKIYK